MQKTTNNIIDAFVLEMITGAAGVKLTESIKRLYITGQITGKELSASVENGFLSLADYNDIITGD